MALVNYSDSEDEAAQPEITPSAKKRKLSTTRGSALPPLPAAFLDQYSSTVRTSTQDDPSLHCGRKRVTPHVEGNWPTHVYLEWHPTSNEQDLLSRLVGSTQPAASDISKDQKDISHVHSLLQNDLGVSLPLHISLSRPLVLKTPQKDSFLTRLQHTVNENSIKTLTIRPKTLAWHPNESKSRWFLVVPMQCSTELDKLLAVCNDVAKESEQPLLYVQSGKPKSDEFHVSIAWSLQSPRAKMAGRRASEDTYEEGATIPYELLQQLSDLEIIFREVKVRIGQDVNTVGLKHKRRVSSYNSTTPC